VGLEEGGATIPDVSVIIPVYNGEDTLQRALDSVAGQSLGPDRLEVLAVDDGSTDGSPAILDRMVESHAWLHVTRQEASGGPAVPRNLALGLARGRYLFFLDQDDYLSPDALEAMVRVADENGTDVVLPRMKGVGGRSAPRAMFALTRRRTDVFASSAYWTLSAIKLFRTAMVRSLDLRFDEDVGVGEDLPFVSMAYLKGGGLSILADKDYVFWANRADGSNIMTSRLRLADRMLGASRMFDLIGATVVPGPNRDALMRRHFEVELLDSAFKAYRIEPDPAARDAAFERFREIAAGYYTENLDAAVAPAGRVLMRLVSQNRPDRFAAYLDALAEASGSPEVLLEGERVFLMLPWFRDPAEGMPDDLFDVARKLGPYCRVEPLKVGAVGVGISAICRLGPLTERVTAVTLIARSRTGEGEATFPLAFRVASDETSPVVQVEDSVPVGPLLSLPKGEVFDLYLRVAAGETWRERRVAECAPVPKQRILRGSAGGALCGMLITTPKGSLSFCVLDRAALARRRLGRAKRAAVRAVRGWFGRTRT
jgi:glycosyltransferase involved in cell wall biosynthesis